MTEEKKLLNQAIKMRERGDRYRNILNYIHSKSPDENSAKQIMKRLIDLEKNGQLTVAKPEQELTLNTDLIMGSFVTALGIILLFFLWDKGYLSFLPFILIIIGLGAIGKSLLK